MRGGPFSRAEDPVKGAREALERGVDPAQVAALYTPASIRRGRLAELRSLLAKRGAEEAVDRAIAGERPA